MEYNKRICDMAVGDQVEGFYVLKTAQIRTSNNGRPFLAAVVSDKTGSMEAKAWDYSGPISTADEGQVIKIRGIGDRVPGRPAAEYGPAAADRTRRPGGPGEPGSHRAH